MNGPSKNKFFLPKIEGYLILCSGFSAKKGEQAFRKWFSRICEIRSLVKGVPLVALTATASKKTKEKIIKALEMEEAVIVNRTTWININLNDYYNPVIDCYNLLLRF